MNVYDKHSRMENIVFKSITIFGTMYVVNVIEIDKYCRINTHAHKEFAILYQKMT